MKKKKLKDASTVGAMAAYDGSGLGVASDLDPKQTKKHNSTRKKLNKLGKQNNQPKEFSVLENKRKRIRKVKKSVVEQMVKEELFDLIIEQGKPDQVMDLFDNVCKMLSLSLQYCRMFMTDGMKLHDDALDFNIKRAKSELDRVRNLTQDMDQILVKTYHKHKKQKQADDRMAAKQAQMDTMQTQAEAIDPRRLKKGRKVKVLRGSYKGQLGQVVFWGKGQIDVKMKDGKTRHLGKDDLKYAEKLPPATFHESKKPKGKKLNESRKIRKRRGVK